MGVLETQSYNTALLEWMNAGNDINQFDAYWESLNPQNANVVPDTDIVPTDVTNAALPWATQPFDNATQLAGSSYASLASMYGADVAAAAQLGAAGIGANAQMGSAAMAAQSRIDAQLIATNGQIASNNARMMTDMGQAAMGDWNAMQRLQQSQAYDAQLQDNKNKLEIAKLMGSGSLFDYKAAQQFAGGMAGQPAQGGAFGLAGGVQPVTVPTQFQQGSMADFMREAMSLVPQAALQSQGGSGYSWTPYSGGGGGFGGSQPDINSLWQGIFDTINAAWQAQEPVTTPPGTTPPPNPNGTFYDPTLEDPYDPASPPKPTFASGGTLKPGESGIVGDAPGGALTPYSEVVKNVGGNVQITPLNKGTGAKNPYLNDQIVDAQPAVGAPGTTVTLPDGTKIATGGFRGGFNEGTDNDTPPPSLPFIQQMNKGALPAIRNLAPVVDPEFGPVRNPYQVANNYWQMSEADRQQYEQLWQANTGMKQPSIFQMIQQATPGWRRFGQPGMRWA